jgi:hypothetical protein
VFISVIENPARVVDEFLIPLTSALQFCPRLPEHVVSRAALSDFTAVRDGFLSFVFLPAEVAELNLTRTGPILARTVSKLHIVALPGSVMLLGG